MQDSERQEMRRIIRKKIVDVEIQIVSLREASRPIAPDNAIGRLTRLEAMNARSISEASLLLTEKVLVRLTSLLSRIDEEDFGLCVECEEEIEMNRLRAMPEAVRCIGCAK